MFCETNNILQNIPSHTEYENIPHNNVNPT